MVYWGIRPTWLHAALSARYRGGFRPFNKEREAHDGILKHPQASGAGISGSVGGYPGNDAGALGPCLGTDQRTQPHHFNTREDESNTDGKCSFKEAIEASDTNTAVNHRGAGSATGRDAIHFSL